MRRKSSIRATAYHEAGHAIAAMSLGFTVKAVMVREEADFVLDGRHLYGATVVTDDPNLIVGSPEDWLYGLAGDAASLRYLLDLHGESRFMRYLTRQAAHVCDAIVAFGEEKARDLTFEASDLIDSRWDDVERMAEHLTNEGDLGDEDHPLVTAEWLVAS